MFTGFYVLVFRRKGSIANMSFYVLLDIVLWAFIAQVAEK